MSIFVHYGIIHYYYSLIFFSIDAAKVYQIPTNLVPKFCKGNVVHNTRDKQDMKIVEIAKNPNL